MGVCIKISDRQGFHMGKQVISDIAHCSLSDIDHDPVVRPHGQHARSINESHLHKHPKQRTEIRIAAPDKRKNIVIDQVFHKQCSCHTCHCAHDDEKKYG